MLFLFFPLLIFGKFFQCIYSFLGYDEVNITKLKQQLQLDILKVEKLSDMVYFENWIVLLSKQASKIKKYS